MKFSPGKGNCCENASPCTNSLCATFDSDWNRIDKVSGLYPVAPPYYENYAPCCFEIEISGITGSGTICGDCDDLNGIHYGGSLSVSGTKIVFNYLLYGLDKYNLCNPTEYFIDSIRGYKILGDYNGSGIDCRNLEFDLDWEILDAPRFCDYSNIGGHVRGLYTPEACQGGWPGIGDAFNGCIHSSSVIVNLPVNDCISISGNTACFIANDCGVTSCIELSGFMTDLVGVKIPSFALSGVIGYDDDIDPSGDTVQTCRKCNQLNKTWEYGEEIPTCCECSNSMCLTSFNIWMITPSSYITLNSVHGPVASWVASTPSGSCPTSPVHFIFSSGSSESWNRCDFSDSAIDLTVEYNNYPSSNTACGTNTDLIENGCLSIGTFPCLVGSSGKPRRVIVTIPDNFLGPNVWYASDDRMSMQLRNCGDVLPETWIGPWWYPPEMINCRCSTKPDHGTFLCEMSVYHGTKNYFFTDCPGYPGQTDPCTSNISPCLSGLYDCQTCTYSYREDNSPFHDLTGCVEAMARCGQSKCANSEYTSTDSYFDCIRFHMCEEVMGGGQCGTRLELTCRIEPGRTRHDKVAIVVTYTLTRPCGPCAEYIYGSYSLGLNAWSKSWYAEIAPTPMYYGECSRGYNLLPSGTYTLTTTPTSDSAYNTCWPYQWGGASITVEIE